MDRFTHPDGVKARDIQLRGGKLVGPVSDVKKDPSKSVDPAIRAGGKVIEPAPASERGEGTSAGSYSPRRRRGYEEMLEEAGK